MFTKDKLAVLRKASEIETVRKEGRSFSNRYVVLVTKKRAAAVPGYALIASRTVGGAVERNRCKRRMRSRVAMFAAGIVDDYDFVLIARKDLLTAEADTLDKAFKQLFMKAGLIHDHD
ncbi:MAG: ribonuclease P protein component [Chloroflexi bacterium]|jgi:ribonuclease P protein component|nr:ribonuclease P protein component [Chloroflexota bacterium]